MARIEGGVNLVMDRIAPTRRPLRPVQGTQRWHRLLFSHWTVPAEQLRPLVPASLAIDTFDGRAFVGVVAFAMQQVRPYAWAPGLPYSFGEINVRTYVHRDGAEPGVYFFSLDAASRVVVAAARSLWSLPYVHARIAIDRCGFAGPRSNAERCGGSIEDGADGIAFTAARQRSDVRFSARAQIGAPLPPPGVDSLEYFLCERYQFYAQRRGALWRARVHHAPYPLHAVTSSQVDGSLLVAAGLSDDGARTPDLFSPGVDVDVYALERV